MFWFSEKREKYIVDINGRNFDGFLFVTVLFPWSAFYRYVCTVIVMLQSNR